MKQKDYKEIADIINNIPTALTDDTNSDTIQRNTLIIKLANYFEKDSDEEINKFSQLDCNCPTPFNRKQFLKDCGVDVDD